MEWYGVVYRFPGRPNSSLIFCSVSLSICPRMEGDWIADMYFIILRIPWVINMHGMLRPRFCEEPWRIDVGNLLQKPDAWRPTFNIGDVICFHSFRERESAGAGYLRAFKMVVFMERRAFCGEM